MFSGLIDKISVIFIPAFLQFAIQISKNLFYILILSLIHPLIFLLLFPGTMPFVSRTFVQFHTHCHISYFLQSYLADAISVHYPFLHLRYLDWLGYFGFFLDEKQDSIWRSTEKVKFWQELNLVNCQLVIGAPVLDKIVDEAYEKETAMPNVQKEN